MSYEVFITMIIIGHIIGDALLQSREMGENKSSNFYVLFSHVSIISVVNGFFAMWFLPPMATINFVILNAVGHFAIDGAIWNLYKLKVRIKARKDFRSQWLLEDHQKIDEGHFNSWLKEKFVPEFKYWKDKDFYTFILTDQALHMLCFIWSLRLVMG